MPSGGIKRYCRSEGNGDTIFALLEVKERVSLVIVPVQNVQQCQRFMQR